MLLRGLIFPLPWNFTDFCCVLEFFGLFAGCFWKFFLLPWNFTWFCWVFWVCLFFLLVLFYFLPWNFTGFYCVLWISLVFQGFFFLKILASSLKLHWILVEFLEFLINISCCFIFLPWNFTWFYWVFVFWGKIASRNFSLQVCGRLVPEQPESRREAERSWVLKGNGKAVTVLCFYGRGFRGAGSAVGRIPWVCILYALILEGFPEISLIFREVFAGNEFLRKPHRKNLGKSSSAGFARGLSASRQARAPQIFRGVEAKRKACAGQAWKEKRKPASIYGSSSSTAGENSLGKSSGLTTGDKSGALSSR